MDNRSPGDEVLLIEVIYYTDWRVPTTNIRKARACRLSVFFSKDSEDSYHFEYDLPITRAKIADAFETIAKLIRRDIE